jgi:flagellar biosynthesis protein FlhF
MQYFTEQGSSHREVLDMIKAKYGDSAQVLSHKTVRMGGFLGLFAREGVEVTGYIRPERPLEARAAADARPRQADFEEEKRKILSLASQGAQAKADQALQQVLAEIQGIRERLDERPAAAAEAGDHQTIRRIDALLALNDFSESFRREAVERLRGDFSLEALEDVE